MHKIKTAAVIGLGAIGIPLADSLHKKLGGNFTLLCDESHFQKLSSRPVYINGKKFSAKVVVSNSQLKISPDIIFVCVKNYSLDSASEVINKTCSEKTIILPLQNGVFSHSYFVKKFPKNIILQGFAQGPNTKHIENDYIYQNPGVYHLGTKNTEWKDSAASVAELLLTSGINCILEDDIEYSVWKKFMLNVAGNALTALTQIDYSQFRYSQEAKNLCVSTMQEFKQVAAALNIKITKSDMNKTLEYFLHYTEPKHTSMLDDLLNKRPTENEYIAGYISRLSQEYELSTPVIDTLYRLMKIREDVYMNKMINKGENRK